jgi:hypothetical protein
MTEEKQKQVLTPIEAISEYYRLKDKYESEYYLMCFEQVLILKHVAYSGRDGNLLPCLEGLLGVLDCSIEFVIG